MPVNGRIRSTGCHVIEDGQKGDERQAACGSEGTGRIQPQNEGGASELVVQTVEDLRSPEVEPKDRPLAMVALKSVSNQLYG